MKAAPRYGRSYRMGAVLVSVDPLTGWRALVPVRLLPLLAVVDWQTDDWLRAERQLSMMVGARSAVADSGPSRPRAASTLAEGVKLTPCGAMRTCWIGLRLEGTKRGRLPWTGRSSAVARNRAASHGVADSAGGFAAGRAHVSPGGLLDPHGGGR